MVKENTKIPETNSSPKCSRCEASSRYVPGIQKILGGLTRDIWLQREKQGSLLSQNFLRGTMAVPRRFYNSSTNGNTSSRDLRKL